MRTFCECFLPLGEATIGAQMVGMECFFCTIPFTHSHLPPPKESTSIGQFPQKLASRPNFEGAPKNS